jgi:hypothetical protein
MGKQRCQVLAGAALRVAGDGMGTPLSSPALPGSAAVSFIKGFSDWAIGQRVPTPIPYNRTALGSALSAYVLPSPSSRRYTHSPLFSREFPSVELHTNRVMVLRLCKARGNSDYSRSSTLKSARRAGAEPTD